MSFASSQDPNGVSQRLRQLRPVPGQAEGEEDDEQGEYVSYLLGKEFRHVRGTISCFCVTRSCTEVITGGFDGQIHRRSLVGPPERSKSVKAHDHVHAMVLSDDESLLVTGGSNNCVRLFRYPGLSSYRTLRTNSRVLCVLIHQPLGLVFCGTYTGRICGWDYLNQQPVRGFKETAKQHERMVLCLSKIVVRCGEEPPMFFSGSEDCTIKQWDLRTGHLMGQINFAFGVSNILSVRGRSASRGIGRFVVQHPVHAELHGSRRRRRRRRRRRGRRRRRRRRRDPKLDDESEGAGAAGDAEAETDLQEEEAEEEEEAEDDVVVSELSIGETRKEFTFRNLAAFAVLDGRILVGWNRFLSRLEFHDIVRKRLLHHLKVHDTVFMRNLACVGSPTHPHPHPHPHPHQDQGERPSSSLVFAESNGDGGGDIVTPMVPDDDDDIPASSDPVTQIYYVEGRDLGRIDIRRSELVSGGGSSVQAESPDSVASILALSQQYLKFDELYNYFVGVLSYDPVRVAQAIQIGAEKGIITSRFGVSIQVDRLMDVFEQMSIEEEEDEEDGGLAAWMHFLKGGNEEDGASNRPPGGLSESTVIMRSRCYFSQNIGRPRVGFQDSSSSKISLGEKRDRFYEMLHTRLPPNDDEVFSVSVSAATFLRDAAREYLSETFPAKAAYSEFEFKVDGREVVKEPFMADLFRHILRVLFAPHGSYFGTLKGDPIFDAIPAEDLYRAAGRMLGHCVFHGIQVPFGVSRAVFKSMLGQAVDYNDVDDVFPDLARRLDEYLKEDDKGTFDRELNYIDEETSTELVSGAGRVMPGDVHVYALTLVKHRLVDSVRAFADGFVAGYLEVVPVGFSLVFSIQEFQAVVCGSSGINVTDWAKSCIFQKCLRTDEVVLWFFESLRDEFDPDEREHLFFKMTGLRAVPEAGILPYFLIAKVDFVDLYDEERSFALDPERKILELPDFEDPSQLVQALRGLLDQ